MYALKVNGMRCGKCVQKLTHSLHDVDRNATVNVDLPNQLVHVDTAAKLETVTAALAQAGYPVVAASLP